jgi:CheY-like chemotaxis protein
MGEEFKIIVVDDHDTFRDPLAFMLKRESDLTVVARPRSLSEAKEILKSAEVAVDVTIVDLNLPDGSGTDLIKDLRRSHPGAKALVDPENDLRSSPLRPKTKPGHRDPEDQQREHVMKADVGCDFDFLRKV